MQGSARNAVSRTFGERRVAPMEERHWSKLIMVLAKCGCNLKKTCPPCAKKSTWLSDTSNCVVSSRQPPLLEQSNTAAAILPMSKNWCRGLTIHLVNELWLKFLVAACSYYTYSRWTFMISILAYTGHSHKVTVGIHEYGTSHFYWSAWMN